MKLWKIFVIHLWLCTFLYCKAKPVRTSDKELIRVKRLKDEREMAGEGELGPQKTRRSQKLGGQPEAVIRSHRERFFGTEGKTLPLRSSRNAREDADVTSREGDDNASSDDDKGASHKNKRFGIKKLEASGSAETEDDDISSSASWETEDPNTSKKERRSLRAELDPLLTLATALNSIAVDTREKSNSKDADDTSSSGTWDFSSSGSDHVTKQDMSPLDEMEEELQSHSDKSKPSEEDANTKRSETARGDSSLQEIVRETRALEPSDENFVEFVRYLRDDPTKGLLHASREFHSAGDFGSAEMHVASDASEGSVSATKADHLGGETLVKRFYRDQETKETGPKATSLPSETSKIKNDSEAKPYMNDPGLKKQLATPRVVYKKEIDDKDTSLIEMPAVYSRSDEGNGEDTRGMDSSDGGIDPNEPNIEIHERGIREDGYLGCYEDESPDRDLPYAVSVSELTPASCRLACKKARYAYAAAQYGYLCRCGNTYGKYRQLPERFCSTKCKGDGSQMCGGFYKSSIFTTDGASEPTEGNFFHVENVQPLFTDTSDELHSTYTEVPLVKQASGELSPLSTATFTAPETSTLPPLATASQSNQPPTFSFVNPQEQEVNPFPPLETSAFTEKEHKPFQPLSPMATSAFSSTEAQQANPLPPLAVSSFTTPEEQPVNPLPPLAISSFTSQEQSQGLSFNSLANASFTQGDYNTSPGESPPAPYIATANYAPQVPAAEAASALPRNKDLETSSEAENKPESYLSQTLDKKSTIPGTKAKPIDHRGHVSQLMYLHPQHDILLKPFKEDSLSDELSIDPGTKVYKGSIKMKQSWTDDMKNKTSAEYQIMAGNIEQAFKKLFQSNKNFVRAKVLGFREGIVKHNPATVTKVVARFALTFKKGAKENQDEVRNIVNGNGKLLDMPVYKNSFKLAEYHGVENDKVDKEESTKGHEIHDKDSKSNLKTSTKKSEIPQQKRPYTLQFVLLKDVTGKKKRSS